MKYYRYVTVYDCKKRQYFDDSLLILGAWQDKIIIV